MIRFVAVGTPLPKGSAKIVERDRRGQRLPRAMLVQENDHKRQRWEASIAGAALAALQHQDRFRFPLSSPIAAVLLFRLRRPEGHFGARGLKPSAPRVPAVKPDIDKLVRSVLDAVTGLLVTDDSRVAFVAAAKLYAAHDGVPGVDVAIGALDDAGWPVAVADVVRQLAEESGGQLVLVGAS